MWGFQVKRNALRDQLVLQAPEANPSEFVRRYLMQRSANEARLQHMSDAVKHRAEFPPRVAHQTTRG